MNVHEVVAGPNGRLRVSTSDSSGLDTQKHEIVTKSTVTFDFETRLPSETGSLWKLVSQYAPADTTSYCASAVVQSEGFKLH